MSKNHRGKGIIEMYRRGRGTCPVCHRTGVKVIHEREIDKKKIEVCKICYATLSRKETMLKKQAKAEETNKPEEKISTAKPATDTVQETAKETPEKKEETTVETAVDPAKEKTEDTEPETGKDASDADKKETTEEKAKETVNETAIDLAKETKEETKKD